MASGADENWTARGVYATICRLYRIEPPFYENRRLSQRDFKAIEAEFVSRVGPRELHRRQRQPSKGLPPSERHLQAHTVLEKIHDYTQAHCVGMKYLAAPLAKKKQMRQDRDRWLWAGKLLFADSAKAQQRARRELRGRLRGRPTPIKWLCRELLRVLPPKSRKQMGWVEEWLGNKDRPSVLRYRAERQFLWAFLKGEARNGDPSEVPQDLVRAYPFLGLTAAQIAAGLGNPHQADGDTARYFGPRNIRGMLSRRRAARRAVE